MALKSCEPQALDWHQDKGKLETLGTPEAVCPIRSQKSAPLSFLHPSSRSSHKLPSAHTQGTSGFLSAIDNGQDQLVKLDL